MKPEPIYADLLSLNVESYDSANYSSGLVGRVMTRGHQLLDAMADYPSTADIIEVGAGSGAHLAEVKRPFRSYTLTDGNEAMLDMARRRHGHREGVSFRNENAAALSVPDSSYDRLIATHVLEHMPDPHLVLREWHRVVRPGGTIALIQPCDPGLAWRLGRLFGPRRIGEKNGLPYDYFMAREHINPIFNLTALIDYYFERHEDLWWPLRVPAADLNLLYVTTIHVTK